MDDETHPWPNPPWNRNTAFDLREAGIVLNKGRYGRNDVISSSLFPWEETVDHRLPNAMWMAEFSELVYHSERFARRQMESWQDRRLDDSQFSWIENDRADTQAFLAAWPSRGFRVLSFRGTTRNSAQDWDTNLSASKVPFFRGGGEVHQGFFEAFKSVWYETPAISPSAPTPAVTTIQKAVAKVGNGLPLYVTGHSLGGALAQLAAYSLASQLRMPPAAVYVFGAPRVGNEDFRNAYNLLLGPRTYQHINHEDVVPRVPFRNSGYRHAGLKKFTFDEKHAWEWKGQPLPAAVTLDTVVNAISRATRYLRESPVESSGGQYGPGAPFDTGVLDNHAIYDYLFKFACAIVEGGNRHRDWPA